MSLVFGLRWMVRTGGTPVPPATAGKRGMGVPPMSKIGMLPGSSRRTVPAEAASGLRYFFPLVPP
jgi:hypothetical protein